IRSGLVVSCETAREINDIMIDRMLEYKSMDYFKRSLATLTGGSGAVALLLSDATLSTSKGRRLLGWANRTAPQLHDLCQWGIEPVGQAENRRFAQYTSTDAASVLTHGVELGKRTWQDFSRRIGWDHKHIDKVICHQVGAAHRETMLKSLSIPESK